MSFYRPEDPPITDEDELRGTIADAYWDMRIARNDVDPLPRLLKARDLLNGAIAFFGGE